MKIRGLLIAAVVFAVLAGVLYWSDHRKSNAEAAKPKDDSAPPILKLDENSLTKLELRKKDAPAILLEKNGSEWKITEPKSFAADQSAVSSIVSSVASLNSERLVDDKSSDLHRYGLAHPSFEVNVTGKDNKTERLLLGDDAPAGNAVYAALAGDPRVFTIAGYTRSSINKGLNDLRDKRLLTVNADKISRVEIAGKNGDVEFGRNKDEWQIVKPKPMRADNEAVSELVRKLTDARMDITDSATTVKETSSAFGRGTIVATINVTGESSTQILQIRKSKESYFAQSSVVDGVYKIGSDLAAAVDKKVEDFRNKKLFDLGYADPNRLDIHSGSKSYSLMRGGQDWWDNGKKMDEASMRSLITGLRNLSADKFVDSGFGSSQIEATVTSNDGKRIEKVLISKSGSDYIAKRDSDSTLYQLPAASVDELQKSIEAIKAAAPGAKPSR
jgi:Domain of unknown function (DUF4340)